ncbi:MAG: L-threonylcarbamoyladenylate synthase [Pseudomonadota bacterium]
MTRPYEYAPTATGIADAADVLRQGGTVAFPTETVYGLGADATNPKAVAAIYAAKGRPSFNPLIAHVATPDQARDFVHVPGMAEKLIAALWPGPLTLVLPLRDDAGLAQAVTAGLDTVAVRMPNHPLALDLLTALGRPLAAPSANPSGRISPTTADHVRTGLHGRIDGLIDGGPCTVGLESTIVAVTTDQVQILRPGSVTQSTLQTIVGQPVARPGATPSAIQAPGQMASHYAPGAPMRLNVTAPGPGEFMIGFGAVAGTINLSAQGQLHMAAEHLFAALHQADASGQPIAVAPIPNTGIGVAINDRLMRAAAPKP